MIAVIAAAVDKDGGQLYAEELILPDSKEGRAMILEAIKTSDDRDGGVGQ